MSLLYRQLKDTVKNNNFRTFRGTKKGSKMISFFFILKLITGHEPDMVYLHPVCVFVDHVFLRALCLRSILQHNSPLTVGA